MPINSNNRRFSYTEPILYNGTYYPTAKVYMDNGNGVAKDSTMFADSNGQYYTMDNDKAYPVDIQYELPEVEVIPSREEMLSAMFDRYLTMSNDRTRVNNVPHREYNTHLKDNALRGAREHALWDKEHPNLSAWRDFTTAVPFGIAATPLVGGLGETALGQAAINGTEKIMSKPAVKAMDSALGLGFGVKGAYDVSQGDATPSTLLELAGIYPGIEAARGLVNFRRTTKEPFISELDWSPDSWFGHKAIGKYDAKDVASLKSHIPEYHKIEQQTKANGTWLQMPDGTTWEGDPRSWVQMMSTNYDNYTGKSPFKYQAFSHSSPNKFDTFDYVHFGETDNGFYGRGFYTHPAENINGKLMGRNSYGDEKYLLTTNVKNPLDLNDPNFEYAGLFNWEKSNAPKGIFDNYDSVYYGIPGHTSVGGFPSELVVPKPTNYKSLLGNNGDFNPLDPNIYKGIVPIGLSTYALQHSISQQ